MLHHTRQLFIRQQTSVINAIQAHLAAFEIVAPVGRQGVEALLQVVADASEIAALGAQLRTLKAQCSSSTGGVARGGKIDRKLLSERIAGSSERLRQLEAMSANKGCNQLRLSVQN